MDRGNKPQTIRSLCDWCWSRIRWDPITWIIGEEKKKKWGHGVEITATKESGNSWWFRSDDMLNKVENMETCKHISFYGHVTHEVNGFPFLGCVCVGDSCHYIFPWKISNSANGTYSEVHSQRHRFCCSFPSNIEGNTDRRFFSCQFSFGFCVGARVKHGGQELITYYQMGLDEQNKSEDIVVGGIGIERKEQKQRRRSLNRLKVPISLT